ncbi:MAG: hypothetical protein EXR20_07080 [Bacteroidetes bacterium]|jgi:hypothetical protein|nr:hypothetical protein [Bacteroidota bacterium]
MKAYLMSITKQQWISIILLAIIFTMAYILYKKQMKKVVVYSNAKKQDVDKNVENQNNKDMFGDTLQDNQMSSFSAIPGTQSFNSTFMKETPYRDQVLTAMDAINV